MNEIDAAKTWCYLTEEGDPAPTLVGAMGALPALEALIAGELDRPELGPYAGRWKHRLDHLDQSIYDPTIPFITPGPAWPETLTDLETPPIGLWVRGSLDVLSFPAISIVGSRSATTDGIETARTMASILSRSHAIVSGGAYGIDIAAHRGALDAGGYTIVVAAGGVDVDYPLAHRETFDAIGQTGGAIISERPPGSRPARTRFLARNRLIAALGRATVVVEASARSGALATARRAGELSRHVCAVPGSIYSPASAGSNGLLRSFGTCVTSGADVLDLLGPLRPEELPLRSITDRLGRDEVKVYDTLTTWKPATAETVATEAGYKRDEAERLLDALEGQGLARQVAGRWIRVEP